MRATVCQRNAYVVDEYIVQRVSTGFGLEHDILTIFVVIVTLVVSKVDYVRGEHARIHSILQVDSLELLVGIKLVRTGNDTYLDAAYVRGIAGIGGSVEDNLVTGNGVVADVQLGQDSVRTVVIGGLFAVHTLFGQCHNAAEFL